MSSKLFLNTSHDFPSAYASNIVPRAVHTVHHDLLIASYAIIASTTAIITASG